MKYYIIAGEVSGDKHGSNLMHSLKKSDPEADIRFWGGDAMQHAGGTMVKHIQDLAFMGFYEVIIHLRTILNLMTICKKDILSYRPDVVILIDYPGFNLRIAEWAKKNGFKVVYYIVPQVWAWHKSRVHKLRKYTDLLLAILPFEEKFYADHGCKVTFVGHPLLDEIKNYESHKNTNSHNLPEKIKIALLPGSRKQEIKLMLPIFLNTVKKLGIKAVIAGSSNIPESMYHYIIEESGVEKNNIMLVFNDMYSILKRSEFAFVTSGTATLETALWDVPQIVAYKGNPLSYYIAKKIITLPFISLVNIILNRKLVDELIQENLTSETLSDHYNKTILDKDNIKNGYATLKKMLGTQGASDKAATAIIRTLRPDTKV
ncbi:MAG: lipid-A-disaccharide synthase [Saprospiraceae bacterium]|nr:lipid-A-disaccharide synthase [Saprospiraceae bacterium]